MRSASQKFSLRPIFSVRGQGYLPNMPGLLAYVACGKAGASRRPSIEQSVLVYSKNVLWVSKPVETLATEISSLDNTSHIGSAERGSRRTWLRTLP